MVCTGLVVHLWTWNAQDGKGGATPVMEQGGALVFAQAKPKLPPVPVLALAMNCGMDRLPGGQYLRVMENDLPELLEVQVHHEVEFCVVVGHGTS